MPKVLSRVVIRATPMSAIFLALALAGGCSTKRIPGTQIPDNPDTRAIVALIDAYREAAEKRNVPAILGLVSPKYFDNGGTSDPNDSVDRQQLEKRLTEDFKKLATFRIEIAVRRIEVQRDQAVAYIYFDQQYRIVTRTGEIAKRSNDLHRMRFVRENKAWRFLSGL